MREINQHMQSCYAAAANRQTDYPQLQGEQRCDVAVFGAGFSGVSTALHLVERDYDAALIRRNTLENTGINPIVSA